jgi:hypothetical protein
MDADGVATSPNDKTPVPRGGMFLSAAYQHTGQASLSFVTRKALEAPQAIISNSLFLRSIGSFERPMMKLVRKSPMTGDAETPATAAMRK